MQIRYDGDAPTRNKGKGAGAQAQGTEGHTKVQWTEDDEQLKLKSAEDQKEAGSSSANERIDPPAARRAAGGKSWRSEPLRGGILASRLART